MPITNEDIAVDLDKYDPPIDLGHLFARSGPVQIEIGSGKGTFLLNQAKAYPQVNFLGIEWANKFYRYSVDRMRRWQINNIRILRTDARDFIGQFLQDESVSVFHVYFPDPWPKKRHHKRRFFSSANISNALRCLESGGQLRVATDHAEYFEVISEILLKRPEFARLLEQIDFFSTDAAQAGEWVGSNFERKYIKEGRNIYTLAVKKSRKTEKTHADLRES